LISKRRREAPSTPTPRRREADESVLSPPRLRRSSGGVAEVLGPGLELKDAHAVHLRGPKQDSRDVGDRRSSSAVDDCPGHRPGTGILSLAEGARYEGELLAGVPHGKGILRRTDGAVYEGEFQGGRPHGQGVLRSKDGAVHEGSFVAGRRTGAGTFWSADGRACRGTFVDGRPSGHVRIQSKTGDTQFEGDFAVWRAQRDASARGQSRVVDVSR